jgi:hypothetical protein
MNQPYSNRELDLMFRELKDEIRTLNTNTTTGFKGVHARLDITNGKVKKIIVALIFVFGLLLGMGFEQLSPLLKFLI